MYSTEFQITTSGNHSIEFYSLDIAGNSDALSTVYVLLDVDHPGVHERDGRIGEEQRRRTLQREPHEGPGRIAESRVVVRSAVLPQLSFEAIAGTGYDESLDALLDTNSTQMNFHEAKFTATQLLYSWGKAYNAIDGAKLEKKRAKADIVTAKRLVKLAVHVLP